MNLENTEGASRFSDRIIQLLERVEHRCAKSTEERDMVFRLRYEAYIRNGLIEPQVEEKLYDKIYDNSSNGWITMTFIDGELAGTTRVHVASNEGQTLPSLGAFSDLIIPHLKAKQTVIDLTRTAARLDLSKQFPELPYVALRPAFLAAEHFNADYAIATARTEHAPFFRRVFRFSLWCEPRDYPNFTAKVACLGADFRDDKDRVASRYPFFRSTQAEREALFGPLQATEPQQHPRLGAFRDFEVRASA